MNNPNSPINSFQQNYMNNMQSFNPQNQNNQMSDYLMCFARGIDGAKQFPLNPNKIAIIFDSTPNTNTFYMKDTTGNGKPFRIFDYTEREEVDETKEIRENKQEVSDLKALVSSLVQPLQELIGTPGKESDNG